MTSKMTPIPSNPQPVTALFLAERLSHFCAELLVSLGTPEGHARIVSDSLVAANVRGVDSHGIQMLAVYIQQVRAGGVNVTAAGRVTKEDGVCLHYFGDNGFGQVVADRCTDHSIRIARALGVSVVVANYSNHFGAGAWWGEKIARAGFIGIAMSNACPAVAPWQGKTAILGTNPLCVAVPGLGGKGRWLLDMATTTVALGKLSHAANLNKTEIPREWGFLDAAGRPTTSTAEAQQGSPTPIGGYKGSALAMMIEILCAGLSGGAMATELPVYRTGGDPLGISHTFIAIDPKRFLPAGEFEVRMDRLVGLVKAAAPAPGYAEVLVAGEPEWRCEKIRQREGIPVPLKLWEKLTGIATELHVRPPQPTPSG
jgi:LDH2 family malate/lactate/ureidoglycolate dehydrogenase